MGAYFSKVEGNHVTVEDKHVRVVRAHCVHYHDYVLGATVVYSKTCLKWPLKIDITKILKTNYSLMKGESIAKCFLGAFCNTFNLHLAIIGLENQSLVFFLSGPLRQVLL